MKQENTVKAHREFDRIIRHGRAIKSVHFALYATPSSLGYARIGISVGKKNGGAVVRVRIKRQVRAMLLEADILGIPLDLIVVVRPCYDREDYAGMKAELLASIDKVKETIH